MVINRKNIWIWIGVMTPFITSLELPGQDTPFDSSMFREAALICEEVTCFSDRSIYVTGEMIRFRAGLTTTGLPDNSSWSSVLYVELISVQGRREASGKFPINNRVSTGELAIPAGLLTGNYLLRCYTRWMRNRGQATYSYVPLRIMNPHRTELAGDATPGDTGIRLSPRTLHHGVIRFEAPTVSYRGGDSVTLDLSAVGDPDHGRVEGCLTVVPAAARPAPPALLNKIQDHDLTDAFQVKFLPDLFGASLSGTAVVPAGSENMLQDLRIHFTLLGEEPGYFVARTDTHGRFVVTLPHREGILDLFIQPENPGNGDIEVRIDHDSDPAYHSISTRPFTLSEEERQLVTIMARKVQLSTIYNTVDSLQKRGRESVSAPFYGSPSLTIHMDDYVLLPTLEEVFLNLVPNVTPVTRKNKPALLIESENPALGLYDPLFMIDQVPCFDMVQFMSVSPAKISRIDVIDDVYVKGDLKFGGIINFHSREKDMAGIDLPGNSFFIDYQAMSPSAVAVDRNVSQTDHHPDTRNTLLWMPDVRVEAASPSAVSFMAPDYPGEYVVLFRGRNERGELISGERTFLIH